MSEERDQENRPEGHAEAPGAGPVDRPTGDDTRPATSVSASGATRGAGESDSEFGFWSMTLMPFRRALVRGLAVFMPPMLTIVLFIWACNTLDSYVLEPIEASARSAVPSLVST